MWLSKDFKIQILNTENTVEVSENVERKIMMLLRDDDGDDHDDDDDMLSNFTFFPQCFPIFFFLQCVKTSI